MSNRYVRLKDAVHRMLITVDTWIDKAGAHAEAENMDINELLGASLAPDMFNFTRQVQTISDSAKFYAARIAGREAPPWADDEKTLAELKARIAKTIAYVEEVQASELDNADEREIRLGFMPEGAYLTADEYAFGFLAPNFYFHCSTAYGILRHKGVQLGKRDFLRGLELSFES